MLISVLIVLSAAFLSCSAEKEDILHEDHSCSCCDPTTRSDQRPHWGCTECRPIIAEGYTPYPHCDQCRRLREWDQWMDEFRSWLDQNDNRGPTVGGMPWKQPECSTCRSPYGFCICAPPVKCPFCGIPSCKGTCLPSCDHCGSYRCSGECLIVCIICGNSNCNGEYCSDVRCHFCSRSAHFCGAIQCPDCGLRSCGSMWSNGSCSFCGDPGPQKPGDGSGGIIF